MLRLKFGERFGPAREIHAGSGYWSQDSALAVMPSADEPTGIWVRWPGGKATTVAVQRGAKEITLEPNGKVEIVR